MSDKENEPMQKDAVPIPDDNNNNKNSLVVAESSSSNETNQVQVYNENASTSNGVINNLLVSNQHRNTTNYSFVGCNGIMIGNDLTVGWSPGSSQCSAVANTNQDVNDKDLKHIKKTPTIKEMMGSKQPLTDKYLDIFCENFGSRYHSVYVLLDINVLFFERMYEDHFRHGGISEVMFQVLQDFFSSHESIATVGWFTRFLWKNGFKDSIWTVKEKYKELKKMEEEDL